MACRSFAGEALERERFGADVVASYHSGIGFAKAKANVESLNRYESCKLLPYLAMLRMPCPECLSVLVTSRSTICASYKPSNLQCMAQGYCIGSINW